MPSLSNLVSYHKHMNHNNAMFNPCFPLVFQFLFHGKYRSHEAGLLYHEILQEFYTHRRKEVESKHHGAAKELTSEHQRFNQTEILFSLRSYIHNM